MRTFLVRDTDRLCRSQKVVGSKAANLALLLTNEYPVPSFFVITTNVFNRFQKDIKKISKYKNEYHNIHDFFSSVNLGSKRLPLTFWQQLNHLFLSLQKQKSASKVSVRSSSPFEDQVSQSFAGQFETFLDIENLNDVWEAVKKCWLSMWQPNVLSYLQQTNVKSKDKAMAVIIQQMINPDLAGVLFTRHPVTRDKSEMLLEFSVGAPDNVVSGKVEPQRIIFDRKSKSLSFLNIDNKKNAQPDQLNKSKELLAENHIQSIVSAGEKLETYFGYSLDIEWCLEKDKLWLLQVRPQTTKFINNRLHKDMNGDMWTDYFFVERFVDPVTPFGWSVIGKLVEKRALRETLHFMGFDKLNRKKNITRLFNYYPFTRIEVFQAMYSVIPDFAISEDKRRAFITSETRPFWLKQLIKRLPYIISRLLFKDRNYIPSLHLAAWDRFLSRYLKQLKENQISLKALDFIELKNDFIQAEQLTDEFLSYHRWSITFADLFFHLFEQLIKLLLQDMPISNCVDLVSGLPGNKTVEANIELAQIAKSLNISTKNTSTLNIKQLEDIPEFQKKLKSFLKTHGHRSQNLDPYYPTWNNDHNFLKKTILDFINNPSAMSVIEQSQIRLNKNRLVAETTLKESLAKENILLRLFKQIFIYSILKTTRSFVLLRENQRYYWHMALAKKREIILEIGRRLNYKKLLSFPELIFFLNRKEFLLCFEKNVDLFFLQQKAEQRFRKWEKTKKLQKLQEQEDKLDQGKVQKLQGLGVSPGSIRSRARVVHSLKDAQNITSGGILVTRSVDPAWTPIFSKVEGMILEVGGILSHASIVAREFRLPTVTSVSGATDVIKNNQIIEIDGLTGTVTIIQE